MASPVGQNRIALPSPCRRRVCLEGTLAINIARNWVCLKKGSPIPIVQYCSTGWWLKHKFYFSIQLGMSSCQLTNSIIFQRGWSATNQILRSLTINIPFSYSPWSNHVKPLLSHVYHDFPRWPWPWLLVRLADFASKARLVQTPWSKRWAARLRIRKGASLPCDANAHGKWVLN